MSINMAEGAGASVPSTNVSDQSAIDTDNRQWTIKGLAPATVEVTREAAKRSGMKLNSFVSLALERAAADVAAGNSTSSARNFDNAELQTIRAELARIRAQNKSLESTVNSMSAILLKLCADRL